MGEFEGKVVLITGASSGIGAGAALRFAAGGALLVLTGRNKEKLDAVCDECKAKGAKEVFGIIAEFTNLDDVKNVATKTIEKFSKLDILINNAGAVKVGNLESSTIDDLDWMFCVNVKSLVYLTQLLMPELVKTKGNIVNISSFSGIYQHVQAVMYNMTKAAVDQFTKTIALEYAPKGVRVNAVNPSLVKTHILRYTGLSIEALDEAYESRKNLHPIGRIGLIEDVVSAIVFLASDASAWTTGQCLILDGGRCLNVPQ